MKIFKAEPLHRCHFQDEQIGLVDSFFVRRERQEIGSSRWMFNEDFARLFNSTNHRSNDLFEIVSNDHELTQKLLGNVRSVYASYSIDESICRWVEEIAQSLVESGRAYYFLHDDIEQEKVYITPLSSNGILHLFSRPIQWVPKRSEWRLDRGNEECPREIRILDTSKVMRFDIPKSIKRMLSTQNKTLAVLDNHRFSASGHIYPEATYENPNPINYFDFDIWKDTQERVLYRATRNTGWHGRNYDQPKCSDFFIFHRMIRFRRNQLLLRDDILSQLSGELSRVGKGYNAELSVEISGTNALPSIAHLNELEEKLACEEVDFDEISYYILKH